MKYFKYILDLLTITIVTSLLIVFCLEEDKEKVPSTNQIVNISAWDSKQNKQAVFDSIENFAKEQHITIYKSQIKHQGKEYTRQTYIFNSNHEKHHLQSFDKSIKNMQLSRNQLYESDVKGRYYFEGSLQQAMNFTNTLNDKGITSEVYNINSVMIFIQVLLDKGLFIPLVGMMFVYTLYYLQVRSQKYKEYALKKLNGHSNFNLILMNLPSSIFKWCCLFGISLMLTITYLWIYQLNGQLGSFVINLLIVYFVIIIMMSLCSLLSYVMLVFIDVPQMIKGLKPYLTLRIMTNGIKILMVALISILIVQNYYSITKLKELENVSNIWNKLDDYYFLEIQNLEVDAKKEQQQDEKFYQFIQSQNKHGALLIKNNVLNQTTLKSYNHVENGNFMFVNQNFLDFYHHIDSQIPSSANGKVIIPSTINQHLKIKHAVKEWYDYQKGLGSNFFKPTLEVINGNYKIYSFDLRTDEKFKYINNPSIIVLNDKDASPNFYKATISQGGYLFKDAENIKKDLKRFGLENDLSGITKYTDQVQSDIQEIKFKAAISTLTFGVSIVVLIFAVIFEIQQYFEQYRKYLLLRKVNGFTWLQNYKNYMLVSNIIMILIFMVMSIWLQSFIVILLGICIIVLQFSIHCICILKLEHQDLNTIKEL